ncbi:MAG: CHAT domain-containing protein [Candidatus Krumholzibacteriota bacterium]|nr:CHAT domain-containing protein [Candidatus Krumholzibacteriota bacterium]
MKASVDKYFILFVIASLGFLVSTTTSLLSMTAAVEETSNARALFDLATRLISEDSLEDADRILLRAATLTENDTMNSRKLLADIHTARGRIALRLGRHAEARPLFEKALRVETPGRGADHAEYVPAISGLAALELIEGDFKRSEDLFRRALEIARPAYGDADPVMIDAVIGYATVLGYKGEYIAAEEILRPHFETVTNEYGDTDDRSIRLMLSRAEVLSTLGRDVESTLLYRRAAAAAEKVYKADHATRALALSGLAHTYRRAGQGQEARSLYRQCIEIVVRKHGSPHPDLVHYRSRLGMSLFEGNRWSEEALASIDLAISEATQLYGEDSYQVAIEKRQMVLIRMGRLEWTMAATVFESCLPTLTRYFGADHPFLSKILKGIAWTYFNMGRSNAAIASIGKAVSLHETTKGGDRFELAYLLSIKASIEIDAGRYDSAFASARRSVETAIGVQEENLQISSSSEVIHYAVRPYTSARGLVTAAAAHPALTREDWGIAFALVARTHGSVLDWQAERHRLLRSSQRARRSNEAVEKASQYLANLVVNGPGVDTAAYHDELERAGRNVEEADRAASAATEELRAGSDFTPLHQRVSLSTLCGALDPGVTLIHFLTYGKIVGRPSEKPSWRLPFYAAFRLSKGDEGIPDLSFIDLGSVNSIDSLVDGYRDSIEAMEAGRRPSARDEAEYRRYALALYERLWAPLFSDEDERPGSDLAEAGAPLILIVPDSRLHEVDFNTLLSPGGTLVIEKWKTHILSSAVDLLKTPVTYERGSDLLAVGNPARDTTDPLTMAPPDQDADQTDRLFCMDAASVATPLPGAEREAAAVAKLFSRETGESTVLLSGAEATESRVKREIAGKRIVHFATHGFVCDEDAMRERMAGETPIDPLLMSGLVLAPGHESDDGLLTAQEVTCLDLRTVDWVVLCSCGSGLGRVVSGEGMFGLRRAFEIAGARTVIMALWRLDDNGTRLLTEEIYARRIAGASTVDAIRETELARVEESRRRFNRIHPSLWGGIISEGDWR